MQRSGKGCNGHPGSFRDVTYGEVKNIESIVRGRKVPFLLTSHALMTKSTEKMFKIYWTIFMWDKV
jgi:hypothetical protein